MAILDAKTVFANAVDVSGATGAVTAIKGTTTWSGAIANGAAQVVDQDKAGDAIGQELTVKIVAGGTAAIAGTTASTLTFKLQTSDTTTDGDFADLLITPALKVDGVKPGTEIYAFRIPSGSKRYMRFTASIGGASISTGAVSIYATRDL